MNSPKSLHTALILAFILTAISCNPPQNREYYQLKIYSLDSESQEKRIDAYLEKAFIPAAHRAGVSHIGVFKPHRHDTLITDKVFVLIRFSEAADYAELPALLDADPAYLDTGKDYLEAPHDNPPYARIESILLRSFEGMPELGIPDHSTPNTERVYELRSYQGATERIYERKVEMFNDAGEIELFMDLGFQPVFFGEVISGPDMPNLMYMTTFESAGSQVERWDAFRTSERWMEMKGLERYKNTVSHMDKYLLYPVEYSDF